MHTGILRSLSGVANNSAKAVSRSASNGPYRLFSTSIARTEEPKASKGIPLALDLDGIHIPKQGQGMYSVFFMHCKLPNVVSTSRAPFIGGPTSLKANRYGQSF